VYSHGTSDNKEYMPVNAVMAKIMHPTPIPKETARAAWRDDETAVLATRIKLCPGLIAPSSMVPAMVSTAIKLPAIRTAPFGKGVIVPEKYK
jgi:hypothetical protein